MSSDVQDLREIFVVIVTLQGLVEAVEAIEAELDVDDPVSLELFLEAAFIVAAKKIQADHENPRSRFER